jgi:hypothetical protein
MSLSPGPVDHPCNNTSGMALGGYPQCPIAWFRSDKVPTQRDSFGSVPKCQDRERPKAMRNFAAEIGATEESPKKAPEIHRWCR